MIKTFWILKEVGGVIQKDNALAVTDIEFRLISDDTTVIAFTGFINHTNGSYSITPTVTNALKECYIWIKVTGTLYKRADIGVFVFDTRVILLADGTQKATADIDLGSYKLENVTTPAAGGDAANKTYVDAGDVSNAADITTLETTLNGVINLRCSYTKRVALKMSQAGTAAPTSIALGTTSFEVLTLARTAGGTFTVTSASNQFSFSGTQSYCAILLQAANNVTAVHHFRYVHNSAGLITLYCLNSADAPVDSFSDLTLVIESYDIPI